MDKHSIDAAVISLANPWLDFMGSEEAKPVARELNAESELTAWRDENN